MVILNYFTEFKRFIHKKQLIWFFILCLYERWNNDRNTFEMNGKNKIPLVRFEGYLKSFKQHAIPTHIHCVDYHPTKVQLNTNKWTWKLQNINRKRIYYVFALTIITFLLSFSLHIFPSLKININNFILFHENYFSLKLILFQNMLSIFLFFCFVRTVF